MKNRKENRKADLRLDKLLRKFEALYRFKLPHGVPPKGIVHHGIEVGKGPKPSHRILYDLLSVEHRDEKNIWKNAQQREDRDV